MFSRSGLELDSPGFSYLLGFFISLGFLLFLSVLFFYRFLFLFSYQSVSGIPNVIKLFFLSVSFSYWAYLF